MECRFRVVLDALKIHTKSHGRYVLFRERRKKGDERALLCVRLPLKPVYTLPGGHRHPCAKPPLSYQAVADRRHPIPLPAKQQSNSALIKTGVARLFRKTGVASRCHSLYEAVFTTHWYESCDQLLLFCVPCPWSRPICFGVPWVSYLGGMFMSDQR